MSLQLVTICGSLRKGSYNRKVMDISAAAFGPARVCDIDIHWPLYHGDEEEATGVPDQVLLAAQTIAQADAVLIASPEYNRGISGALKNALDWISRTPHRAFFNKPVAVMSAAAGRTGGESAQYMTRLCLIGVGALVIAQPQVAVAAPQKEFGPEGQLENEVYLKTIETLMQSLRQQAERGA